ncbi:MAG: HD domain-containing protein [Adlercreutzia equolifaciens]
MSAERDDSVRAAADAVSAGKATKETVDALLGRRTPRPIRHRTRARHAATASPSWRARRGLHGRAGGGHAAPRLRVRPRRPRGPVPQVRRAFIHPIEVGIILADLRMDAETITAALLHDTVEDTKVTAEEVERTFNPQVRALVEGVTKITRIEVESLTDEQAATIRKMFVAMSKDIRVILIKLADRLHNMRTLAALREDRRIFKSRETLEIYAPSPTASIPSSGSWRTCPSSTWSPTSTSRSPAW